MRNNIHPIWTPSDALKKNSAMHNYMQWLKTNNGPEVEDYESLWQWSIENPGAFWGSFWSWTEIKSHRPYNSVMKRPVTGMIGTNWFEGSSLNYAEHIFSRQTEQFPAIIFQTESGSSKEISWKVLRSSVAKLAGWMKEKLLPRVWLGIHEVPPRHKFSDILYRYTGSHPLQKAI